MGVEVIIWFLFLLDSFFANLGAWFFPKWYKKNFPGLAKHLPLAKGWTAIYLLLVLWVGFYIFFPDVCRC